MIVQIRFTGFSSYGLTVTLNHGRLRCCQTKLIHREQDRMRFRSLRDIPTIATSTVPYKPAFRLLKRMKPSTPQKIGTPRAHPPKRTRIGDDIGASTLRACQLTASDGISPKSCAGNASGPHNRQNSGQQGFHLDPAIRRCYRQLTIGAAFHVEHLPG